MATSAELYELFLALAPARLAAARDGLADERARRSRVAAALVPLAVDSLLLGADGVAELARAVVEADRAPVQAALEAVAVLERSMSALGHGDESGARIDETELKRVAVALREGGASTPASRASRPPPGGRSPDGVQADTEWVPTIAEDMVRAFLDECSERIDALSDKLLELEDRRDDKELVSALFRDLHTLKGGSAFAGLVRMNRVAHAAEDLVAELRGGQRVADKPVVDALLAALDVLRAILDRAQRRAPIDIDPSGVLELLADPSRARVVPPVVVGGAEAVEDRTKAAAVANRLAQQAGAGTLRIDFEKVDLLLNLVGELVLARGRLAAAAERHASIPQELAVLRRQVASALGETNGRVGAHVARADDRAFVDDLERTERVLGESWADLDSGLVGLGQALGQMRDHVMKLRMVPIARLFTKYQRTVRELAGKLGKEVRVELEGADTELDKVLVERLDDPLLHLVRNAVDHGIETPDVRRAAGKPSGGLLRLCASQRGGSIIVAIVDDGAGMDPQRLKSRAIENGILTEAEAAAMSDREAFELIFRPGFSTAAAVTDVSGRGVGMDVVRQAIAALKGTVVLESQKGSGSMVELRLPLTLAITQILAVRVGGEAVAVPLDAVVSAQAVTPMDLEAVAGTATLRVSGKIVPVVDLASILGLEQTQDLAHDAAAAYVVVVDVGGEPFGLLVQQLLGRHEVVIKSLGTVLANAPFAAGATLVDDRVLLLLDLAAVTAAAAGGEGHQLQLGGPAGPAGAPAASRGKRILVVEDSQVVREGIRRAFEARGYDVAVATDGAEALAAAASTVFDAITTDVMMPNVDGYQLTRALRADARYKAVPIVMLTSKDARIDELRGLDAGADAYLTKPVDAGDLVRQTEALLARAATRQ